MTDSVPEFISQRRRWLNGAFFAAVYSLVNGKQIWKTDHTIVRKLLLQIEAVYQFLNLLFTYFGLVRLPYLFSKSGNANKTGKLLFGILLHCRVSFGRQD